MSAIYDEKKDEDGFLYVTYSGENTFGDLISHQHIIDLQYMICRSLIGLFINSQWYLITTNIVLNCHVQLHVNYILRTCLMLKSFLVQSFYSFIDCSSCISMMYFVNCKQILSSSFFIVSIRTEKVDRRFSSPNL